MKNPLKFLKKESKPSVSDQLTDLLSRVGKHGVGFKMAKDIFTETNLTIHQEKARCKKAYNDNSFIQVSVNYLLNVLEGENPEIKSENEVVKKYADKWEVFSGWKRARKEAEQEAIITGDGYIRKIKGDKGSFKYQHIENSEDVYIEWDFKKEKPKRYIKRLYYTQAQAKKLGIKQFQIKSIEGIKTIFGIDYDPSEIIHVKWMNNYWRVYGRSPIASVLNDVEIMNRVERSIAVISMFKAVPQKVLTPKADKETPNWTENQIKLIEKQIKDQKDYESPIIGTPIDAINLTDSGQIIELTGYLDYFKRKISIALSPEFIVHGELVNRNTSVEQKQLFYLSIKSIRDYFINTINDSLIEGLTASVEVLRKQGIEFPNAIFWFEYGQIDVELREQKNQRLMNEWNMGVITLNEYREQMGYDPDDFGDFKKFELMPNQSDQAIEKLKQALDYGNKEKDKENN